MSAGKSSSDLMVLVNELRKTLQSHADPAKAGPMQAYMKSPMPFLGIQTPKLRTACRTVFARFSLESPAAWQAVLEMLWRSAQYREERYAAIELAGYKAYRRFETMTIFPLYEEMITTGAWWDYVDPIAAHRVGALLYLYPSRMKIQMRLWARDENIWKRRTAILCQLTFKQETDVKLLYECIEPSLREREFFLRKAIGWALRQYARVDPEEVIRYIKAHRKDLSLLSQREALKAVLKAGRLDTAP
jgi:3-methyladenine DNA glycosylase AlkD